MEKINRLTSITFKIPLDGGKRLYDRETMTDYLNDILDNLDKHEELHH